MEIKNEKGQVVHTNHISRLIEEMRKRNILTNSITRYQYLQYDVEESLQLIDAIGKSRDPKFVIDDDNRFTYTNLVKWIHCDTTAQCLDPETRTPIPAKLKRGIYIAGNTGTGKSWALEIILAYAKAYGFRIKFDDEESRLSWVNFRSDEICSRFAETGSIDSLKKVNVIGIQDLGSEPAESCYMGNRLNVLRNLIEARGDRSDTITFITSNIPINHKMLVEQYNDRVASRLCEMCNYYEIRGVDRRKM